MMGDDITTRKQGGGGGVAVFTNGVCFGDENHNAIIRNNLKPLSIKKRQHPSYPLENPNYVSN